MTDFKKRIVKRAMNLFNHSYDMDPGSEGKSPSLAVAWQSTDIISSNCPVHVGVKLGKMSDNAYQCPVGKEIYKAKSNLANQTSKDRYDLGISIK